MAFLVLRLFHYHKINAVPVLSPGMLQSCLVFSNHVLPITTTMMDRNDNNSFTASIPQIQPLIIQTWSWPTRILKQHTLLVMKFQGVLVRAHSTFSFLLAANVKHNRREHGDCHEYNCQLWSLTLSCCPFEGGSLSTTATSSSLCLPHTFPELVYLLSAFSCSIHFVSDYKVAMTILHFSNSRELDQSSTNHFITLSSCLYWTFSI